MTSVEWRELITEAALSGVESIQFIGGEPTLHPDFTGLLSHAIESGMNVELFSNLVDVRDEWWELLSSSNASLAFSYYSDQAAEHGAITGRLGSHARTRSNIAEAVKRGIPVRAGIITVHDGQRVHQAREELEALGVSTIHTDRMRGVGRGALRRPDVSQLCGALRAGYGGDLSQWRCVAMRPVPMDVRG